MFTTLIVQPIFNLLVLIYALLPGHNFGLAVILFTILVRLLMWPLVKKQLHHAKAMRELQPEIKRIKKEAKGNRQQESLMLMALYKEREINPFASLGLLIVQFPILIGLYSGLNRLVQDPDEIVNFAYPFIRNLSWMQELATDVATKFDATLFGVVDLTRAALGSGSVYWPAMLIVIASALTQYYQSKQLMPDNKSGRSLRTIMKEANQGKEADQTEVNAAVGRSTRFLIPALIFVISVNIASALALYWFVSGLVAVLQQAKVLKTDEEVLRKVADETKTGDVIEGEVVAKESPKPATQRAKNKKKQAASKKKRRR